MKYSLRELKLIKANRLNQLAHKFYTPTRVGEHFIDLFGKGNYFILLFSAANGVGKCKKLDSPILMADGHFKKLGDIVVGDKILGHNYNSGIAEPSTVEQTTRAGKKKIYRFVFQDGGFVEASQEHSFPVKIRSGRNSNIIKKTVAELLKYKTNYLGGKIKFQSPKLIDFKQNNKLPIHPYLLGALLGDGGLYKHSLHFTNIDKEVLAKIKRLVEKEKCILKQDNKIDFRIVQYKKNKQGYPVNELKNKLEKLGLVGKKSGDKFIPHIYKTASVENRKQLLAGLIDTDGTFKEYTSKSKQLADDFCFIIKSLGGRANLKDKIINNEFTHNQDKMYYRVYWKFDYKLPLQIDRKQEISKRPVEYSNRIVKEIKYMGEFECGDIFINHSQHCYLSDDFVSTGNTYLGVNILAQLFWPCDNIWFTQKNFIKWPHLKRIRIVSEPTTIITTLIPLLKEVFPKGRYKTEKKGKTYDYWWETDTGWTFEIMSYDQDVKEFESATLGLVWFDEPPPEVIYKASIARLRKGGQMMITATPLLGSGWMYDHIICNVNREKGNRTFVEADVSSACIDHGTRGYLRHADIEKMVAEYSEDEKQARIKGKFQHLTGLVYKQWDRRVHVIRPFEITMQDYCVVEMIDPHPRNPDMVSWVAVDKHGQYFIVDELWLKCQGGTEELAQRIKKIAGQYRIIRRLGDPSMFIEDQHTEKSLATRLASFGLNYLPATKTRTASNQRLGDALNFQKLGDEFIKTPEIYYFETCQRHIYEMEHWRWDEWKGKTGYNKDKKEKPIDKDDHGIENVGRCLIQEPYFVPYTKINKVWQTEKEDVGAIGGGEDPFH